MSDPQEDPWNAIGAGALTGGFLQLRFGLSSAAKSAAFGGFLLVGTQRCAAETGMGFGCAYMSDGLWLGGGGEAMGFGWGIRREGSQPDVLAPGVHWRVFASLRAVVVDGCQACGGCVGATWSFAYCIGCAGRLAGELWG